jgi:DNA-binding MarR family transcriptional regulator
MTAPAPGAPADLARVWRLLRALVVERDAARRAVCDELGMSFVRVKMLRRLAAGALTQRLLGEALCTEKAYTTVLVDDLERRGLVARAPHPGDRRAKLVTLTPAGQDAVRRSEEILGAPPPVLAALDSADLATLERIVSALVADQAP